MNLSLRLIVTASAILSISSSCFGFTTEEYGDFKCDFVGAGEDVTISDETVTGVLDWSNEMKNSVSASLNYWSSIIAPPPKEKIKVVFVWENLGTTVLGSASPAFGVGTDGFTYSVPEIVWRDQETRDDFNERGWLSLAEDDYHVVVRLSSGFRDKLYYGAEVTDIGATTDFQSVLTHEIGHSMGFFSGGGSPWAVWGFGINTTIPAVTAFDGLMVVKNSDGTVTDLWEYELDDVTGDVKRTEFGVAILEQQEGAEYSEGREYFLRDKATGEGDGVTDLSVYNPETYQPGSSMSHIDAETDEDALMQYSIGQNKFRRELSTAELGVMRSMGWQIIPEPSLFGVIAGTLALVLAGTRRRRR